MLKPNLFEALLRCFLDVSFAPGRQNSISESSKGLGAGISSVQPIQSLVVDQCPGTLLCIGSIGSIIVGLLVHVHVAKSRVKCVVWQIFLCVWSTLRDVIAGVVQTREMSPSRCHSVQLHYSQQKHNTVPSKNTPRSRACPCRRMQMNPSSALCFHGDLCVGTVCLQRQRTPKNQCMARLSCPRPPPPSQEPTEPTAFRLQHIAVATHQSLFALQSRHISHFLP